MEINKVSSGTQSFGALSPKNPQKYIKGSFDIALSRGVIFPRIVRSTAAKLYKQFPEQKDLIFKTKESTEFLLPMFREEAKSLSLAQRLWTYLVQIPHKIKNYY